MNRREVITLVGGTVAWLPPSLVFIRTQMTARLTYFTDVRVRCIGYQLIAYKVVIDARCD